MSIKINISAEFPVFDMDTKNFLYNIYARSENEAQDILNRRYEFSTRNTQFFIPHERMIKSEQESENKREELIKLRAQALSKLTKSEVEAILNG